MKTCSRCNQERPLGEFSRDTRCKDHRSPWCRECRASYQRERRGKALANARQGKPSRVGAWGTVCFREIDTRRGEHDADPEAKRAIGAGVPMVGLAVAIIDRAMADLARTPCESRASETGTPTWEERETAWQFFDGADCPFSFHDCVATINALGSVHYDADAIRARARAMYEANAPTEERQPRARIVALRGAA